VFGDFQHPLTRHIPPAQHILEEGDYIRRLFRPAKRDEKN
jgi:hypothetical protein